MIGLTHLFAPPLSAISVIIIHLMHAFRRIMEGVEIIHFALIVAIRVPARCAIIIKVTVILTHILSRMAREDIVINIRSDIQGTGNGYVPMSVNHHDKGALIKWDVENQRIPRKR
jgi:hypothetical protein